MSWKVNYEVNYSHPYLVSISFRFFIYRSYSRVEDIMTFLCEFHVGSKNVQNKNAEIKEIEDFGLKDS